MSIEFCVGRKVVCISDDWIANHLATMMGDLMPIKDKVYTIRDITTDGDNVGLRLKEIRNPKRQYVSGFEETAFTSKAFRPLLDKKTDISVFQKILNRTGCWTKETETSDA